MKQYLMFLVHKVVQSMPKFMDYMQIVGLLIRLKAFGIVNMYNDTVK